MHLTPPSLRIQPDHAVVARTTAGATTDVSPAASTRGEGGAELSLAVFKEAYDRLSRHAGNSLAGGLAFGGLLSIAPLLIVVIAVVSGLVGEGTAREQTLALVTDTLGAQSQDLVAEWIDQARAWSGSATILGVVLFLLGSARLVGLVDESFEIVFEVPPKDDMTFVQSVKLFLKTQATSIGVTLVAGLVMAASLVLRALGTSIVADGDPGVLGVVWMIGKELVSVVLWTLGLAVIYRVLPPVKLDKRDVLRGALVSAVLLEGALLVLRAFASNLELGAAYGTAGAVVATVMTLYIMGQLFFYGAEVTAELAERRDGPGKHRLTDQRAACTTKRSDDLCFVNARHQKS